MKPRNALIFLTVVVGLTAWWQVESRLTTARDLNRKLSVEAAYLVKIQDDKPEQPDFMPTAPTWPSTAADRLKPTTTASPSPPVPTPESDD